MASEQSETRVYRAFAKIFAKKVGELAMSIVLLLLGFGVFVGVIWAFTEVANYIIQTTAINDNRLSHMSVTICLILVSVITIGELGKSWTEAKREVDQND